MTLYLKKLSNSFREWAAYRADLLVQIFYSFLYLFLKISIWQALFWARGGQDLQGIEQNDMIVYLLLSEIAMAFVPRMIWWDMDDSIKSGQIVNRMLLPLNLWRDLSLSNLMENCSRFVFSSLPVILIGLVVYRPVFAFSPVHLLFFLLSMILGYFIGSCVFFMFGLVTFWLEDTHFFEWFSNACFTLFSGSLVPMWFFPEWLNGVSLFLPFRYMGYEALNIMVARPEMNEILSSFGRQALMALGCWLLAKLVWIRAQKRIFVQGG